MRPAAIALTLVLAATAAGRAQTAGDSCTVADPTGTPLNVRETPNGRKLEALLNGSGVEVIDTLRDGQGRIWARVAVFGETVGWVFGPFLDC